MTHHLLQLRYARILITFHRSLKEEEVWTSEYRSLEEARASIARWIEEYNHDRPNRGVKIALCTRPSVCIKFGGLGCLVLRGALQALPQFRKGDIRP
jgi:hypothetical protein